MAEAKEVDESRPLSKSGAEITEKIATYLHKKGVVINEVCHSGKLRAEQTASIFAEILNAKEIIEIDGMNPNDDPPTIIGNLIDSAMYVGHLPHIQKVVSILVTGDENNQAIAFHNSAVACIEIECNQGYLKWFITPDLCA
jgi:phosphohistidine phosphatase